MTENTPNNYLSIVADLKNKIRQAKTKAALSVNKELLFVYWEIGHTILLQQKSEGWGTKIIDRLSQDLKAEFPDMQGLSVRNIKYMRAFAEAYPEFTIVQPAVAQMQDSDNQLHVIVQQAVAQLPNSFINNYYYLRKSMVKQFSYMKKARITGLNFLGSGSQKTTEVILGCCRPLYVSFTEASNLHLKCIN